MNNSEKSYLYTQEGFYVLKELRLKGIETEEAKRIISKLDNLLSTQREIVRQYQICYGNSHNWLNVSKERLRVAKMALEEAEEAHATLSYHNL